MSRRIDRVNIGNTYVTGSLRDPRYTALIEDLKKRRQRCGFTQAELASQLGRIQQFVSKYEAGERRLDVIELCDIAVALDTDVGSILAELSVSVHMLSRR